MEAIKTIKFVSGKLTRRKLKELHELSLKFKKLVNLFLNECFKHGVSSKGRLHSIAYEKSKKVVPKIHSKYRYKAMDLALGIYKSWATRIKRGNAMKPPKYESDTILLYHDSSGVSTFKMVLKKKRTWKLFVKIAAESRKYTCILFPVSEYHMKFLKQISEGKLRIGDAKIILRDNRRIEFHLTIKKNVNQIQTRAILAIDVNERNTTITVFDKNSKREVFSEIIDTSRIFWIDSAYIKIMRRLQEKLYKGHNPKYIPKWKKEIIKRRLRRWRRRREDLLHKFSRHIVEIAKTFKAEIIMEDLKHIKQRILNKSRKMNRRLSLAPIRKLQEMIEYKAKWIGIPVNYVNPRKTSTLCPKCGQRVTMTGKPRVTLCPRCRIMYHRDYLACLNLVKRVMGGVSVPHDSPMKWMRRGVVLPNEVSIEGRVCAMMISHLYK